MHATIRPAAAFALCSVVALSAGCGGAPTGARDGLRLELSVDRAAIAVGTGDGLSRASLPPGAYHAYARLGRGPSDPFIQSRVATFEVR